MAKREPNPNTAYGRKRMREEYQQRKALMTPEERSTQNATEFWVYLLVIIVVGGLIFLIGGSGALFKWMSH